VRGGVLNEQDKLHPNSALVRVTHEQEMTELAAHAHASYVHVHVCKDDDDVFPRETPPHIRTARASPQRHTAAGTAAPTTADTGNTVPQRANPTQTAYAHPRRRAQAQGQALRHMDAGPSTKRSRCAYSTQGYHREIGTSTITVTDVGLRPGFLPPRRAGVNIYIYTRTSKH